MTIKFSFILVIITIIWSCSSTDSSMVYESDNLKIKQISENTWVHISYLETDSYGKVPCNGAVFANDEEAIVLDAPSTDAASEELLNFLDSKDLIVKAVVPTHFHFDCLGGIEPFHAKNITSYANEQTFILANDAGDVPLPQRIFDQTKTFKISGQEVIIKYFGAGHTSDNVVAYFPSEEVLFGGCLIKSINAGKGNLEDADTLQWSKTVANIKKEYPNLKTVVPGHGPAGGLELLDFTVELFKN